MEMVNIKINGQALSVPSNYTVLEAARSVGIEIPTLCYLKDVSKTGSCRMCIVEVVGARNLQAACVYPVSEGMEVLTNTQKVRDARRINLELLLSNHDRKCLTCARNQNCELQKLADELGVTDITYMGERNEYDVDEVSPSIVRDNNKCVLCRRCVSACKTIQTVSVIDATERGFKTTIASPFNKSLAEVPCVNCGQCIVACPVGALREKDNTDDVWAAINDPEKYVVVQTAPAVRVGLGEEFGYEIGTPVTGKMAAALRRMGFDGVFDTDTGADLTIMEEGTEFIDRLQNGGKLPMITSCSPGWIKFCEHNFPDFLDNLSSCKSPHQMFGAILKTYYAEKMGIDPKKMFVVSVMPCVAKKFESGRPEMEVNSLRDVDAVISTRELAKMIKESGILFSKLPDEKFDNPFEEASGAGVIFGATGGVMEAALRTVVEVLEGKSFDKLDYEAVRGTDGIKEATLTVAGTEVKVAVVSGLGNARKLLNDIRDGKSTYHFIEVMACPGGCVTGGGQPIVDSQIRMDIDLKAKRAAGLYAEDKSLPVRKSHENPDIKLLYSEFLEKPGSHKAHELLHTHYTARSKF
ncbi:MAG: 2Fe-2S iron-sulfur cluster binding domain-containing protein [Ruminococcaceae bacterium]|nr:2Fe-2S iron-sulfur cluster binding domain-containing protein [Oscillospiraceae bacterium]